MPSLTKEITRKEEITEDFLKLVEQHIDDLLNRRTERRYHPNDFAKLLFVHSRHLTNTIKETTGKSPCDIMEERVLAESQKMLLETDLPIADIANTFGYNEPTNFTKFFKGLAGITPLKYRKNLRGNS